MPFPKLRTGSGSGSTRVRLVTALLAVPIALSALVVASGSTQARPAEVTGSASPQARSHPSCNVPAAGQLACMSDWTALQPVPAKRISAAAVAPSATAGSKVPKPKDGLTPADLRAAYKLPAKGGKGITVGIVDAYDHPKAESDLKVYRSAFKLPACTTANKCFRKVNQNGKKKYPEPDAGWAGETALDIQAVSAVCPQCSILLVEADDPSFENLGKAVNTAVRLGADVVSNSYGGNESAEQVRLFSKYYRHPKVPMVAASGDDGWATASAPAVFSNVWSVGGTTLTRSKTKAWVEKAWRHGGSACSDYVAKPSFQKDKLCAKHTVADVSVVAEGFATYDTYGLGEDNGWILSSGTSLSSPLLAGMMGLAGHPQKLASPGYAYAHPKGYKDIVTGRNGLCENALCNAGVGYDAPTGVGAPRGLKGL
jgi:subtilase family serine protease